VQSILVAVQTSIVHGNDSDAEDDCSSDRTKMLSDVSEVKLRHCGFCGIEVWNVAELVVGYIY